MTHRKNTLALSLAVAAGSLLSTLLVGCGEEPPAVVQAPPPPPPKVVVAEAPKLTSIKDLMAKYDIDQRVTLPEDRAPDTDEARIAVLKFFDAFARGNADALKPMLSAPDQFQLDGMVAAGSFAKSTAAITRIDVRCGKQENSNCTLAVFHVGEGFEPQLWSYTTGGKAEFDAIATPPGILNKLSGDNQIAAWFEVLKLELAKADEPDESPEMPKQDFTKEDEGGQPTASEGDVPAGVPGGLPGKRMPGAPIKAPKGPGFGTK